MIRAVVIIAVFLGLWQAASLGVAELLNRRSVQSLSADADPSSVHKSLLLAAKLDSDNPRTLMLLARTASELSKRLDYQRELTSVAPNHAEAWSELFVLKARAGELDAEAYAAFDAAVRLGTHEPYVQERLIQFGSDVWLRLDSAYRSRVIELAELTITNAITYRLDQRITVLKESGLLPIVCSRVGSPACPLD